VVNLLKTPLQLIKAYRDGASSFRVQGDFLASSSFAASFEASDGRSGEREVAWESPAVQSWIYSSKDDIWCLGWENESLGGGRGYFY